MHLTVNSYHFILYRNGCVCLRFGFRYCLLSPKFSHTQRSDKESISSSQYCAMSEFIHQQVRERAHSDGVGSLSEGRTEMSQK